MDIIIPNLSVAYVYFTEYFQSRLLSFLLDRYKFWDLFCWSVLFKKIIFVNFVFGFVR